MKIPKLLIYIFILALIVRFLYFPNNVNFSYDQARDSFVALDILKGDIKIVGPPTTFSDKVFHGPLFYYLIAPIYFFSGGNPEVAASFLRLGNALGVFLVFLIAKNLFNRSVGLISAILFALSFEQTQYSLFFGHPALGVISVLIFYWGLSELIFNKWVMGLVIALLGLSLSIQFEDVNGLFIINLIVYLWVFYKNLKILNLKVVLLGILVFTLIISTFILAEIKFGFRGTTSLISSVNFFSSSSPANVGSLWIVVKRLIHDNFLTNEKLVPIVLLILIGTLLVLVFKNSLRKQGLFLLIWFLLGLIPNLLSKKFSYYYTPGLTVSLLIAASFLIYRLSSKQLLLAVFLIFVISFSSLNLIITQNSKGVNTDILVQPEFLTLYQKQALDYIYQKAEGENFAVSAITVPLKVKTTWDYLFNWYGLQKYHYLPVWGSEAADGFYGTLTVETSRSKLPFRKFLIIEPTVGIEKYVISSFIREENYFSKVVETKNFGRITVQTREKI